MLFAIDVGNTNLTLGLYEGSRLAEQWRLRTDPTLTVDGWGILFRNLFSLAEIEIGAIDGMIVSSVVPPLDESLASMADRYFGVQPVFVTSATDTGLAIATDFPQEVGADRIVNSVAAWERFGGGPCVSIDFGTAVTFDVVSKAREYVGGLIYPGLGVSSEALFQRTARLPQVAVRDPGGVVGKNTVAMIESGLYFGTMSVLEGVLRRLSGELGPLRGVVATGGQASMVCRDCAAVDAVDENLTLDGLRLIWERCGAG